MRLRGFVRLATDAVRSRRQAPLQAALPPQAPLSGAGDAGLIAGEPAEAQVKTSTVLQLAV